MNLQGKSVLVLGLGISGLAMLRWCAMQGAAVRVADSRAEPPSRQALREEWPALDVHLGVPGPSLLDGIDLLAVSPGIAPHDCAFGPLIAAARQRGIAVLGELGLFMAALRDLGQGRNYAPKVLAVTGTNGKTTVTALTAELLRGAGMDAVAAGNIGPAMLDVLRERLAENRLPAAWVLELSSFQLHGVDDFAAGAATVLNVTQDHLDWHGSMEAYAADKARIFGPQPWSLAEPPGLMLLNRDDAQVMAMRREGRRQQTFGLDAPGVAGDWGVAQEQGMAWLVRAQSQVDEETPKRRGKGALPAAEAPVVLQRLMPADALRIRGRHNWANALAALALAESAGAPLASMLHGLRAYRGEPHRMQVLGVVRGVEWIEDSKGTNVGATVAALRGMDRPVVLIAGGDGKGQDFAPLAQAATGKLRAAVLIGRDAARLAQALGDVCPTEQAESLEQAVQRAAALAFEGDVALLSPACASLDMFRNYVHRAEVFAAAVREWAESHGAMLEVQP
ncbi:MAG: UDP-N-acetylmuramoyl-L-alanine--D-glutamate ligase [Thiomonas delicata]